MRSAVKDPIRQQIQSGGRRWHCCRNIWEAPLTGGGIRRIFDDRDPCTCGPGAQSAEASGCLSHAVHVRWAGSSRFAGESVSIEDPQEQ